jgi:hypothetical protein
MIRAQEPFPDQTRISFRIVSQGPSEERRSGSNKRCGKTSRLAPTLPEDRTAGLRYLNDQRHPMRTAEDVLAVGEGYRQEGSTSGVFEGKTVTIDRLFGASALLCDLLESEARPPRALPALTDSVPSASGGSTVANSVAMVTLNPAEIATNESRTRRTRKNSEPTSEQFMSAKSKVEKLDEVKTKTASHFLSCGPHEIRKLKHATKLNGRRGFVATASLRAYAASVRAQLTGPRDADAPTS